jgi:hypothetical protein
MFLRLVNIAEEAQNNKSENDIFMKNKTKLKIQDINQVGEGKLLITTSSVVENFSLFFNNWSEIHFILEYDVTQHGAVELLEALGYNEFQNISILDFMKIKSKGRKLYKFITSDAININQTIKRSLDMKDYDDVRKVYLLYKCKVMKYQSMVQDIKWFQSEVEIDKDRHEINVEQEKKYEKMLNDLLEEMPD